MYRLDFKLYLVPAVPLHANIWYTLYIADEKLCFMVLTKAMNLPKCYVWYIFALCKTYLFNSSGNSQHYIIMWENWHVLAF